MSATEIVSASNIRIACTVLMLFHFSFYFVGRKVESLLLLLFFLITSSLFSSHIFAKCKNAFLCSDFSSRFAVSLMIRFLLFVNFFCLCSLTIVVLELCALLLLLLLLLFIEFPFDKSGALRGLVQAEGWCAHIL
jgi:hypothetical protein